jgi:hypothetical protein
MANLIHNEASWRIAPAEPLPREERLIIPPNLDDNPRGICYQNHTQEASNLINFNHTLAGFPMLAIFPDNDHMLYRRFAHLHVKLLSRMQNELLELEEALENLDQEESIGMPPMARDEQTKWRLMLAIFEQKLAEYCKQTKPFRISFRCKSDSGFCNSRIPVTGTRLPRGRELERY